MKILDTEAVERIWIRTDEGEFMREGPYEWLSDENSSGEAGMWGGWLYCGSAMNAQLEEVYVNHLKTTAPSKTPQNALGGDLPPSPRAYPHPEAETSTQSDTGGLRPLELLLDAARGGSLTKYKWDEWVGWVISDGRD